MKAQFFQDTREAVGNFRSHFSLLNLFLLKSCSRFLVILT